MDAISIKKLTLNARITDGTLMPERLADLLSILGGVFAPFDLWFRLDQDELTQLVRETTEVGRDTRLWLESNWERAR